MRRFPALLSITALLILAPAACKDSTKPNTPPSANAGPDMSANVGEVVHLNGSASSDPDKNSSLTYTWSFVTTPAGSTATLSGATSVSASFIPDVGGQYTVRLTVSDGEATSTDDCVVTVNNPPVANAGPDQSVNVGEAVQLDGSGSSDPDGVNLTYSWSMVSRPAGSNATIQNPSSATPTFTPDVGGQYTARLTVSDGEASRTDDCVVMANAPPTAEAGPDQTVNVGNVVQLNGGGSSDPEGGALTYSWSMASRPAGSTATLQNAASATPTFTPDRGGEYVVRLVVSDGKLSSQPDDCTISANTPPVANAGPNQTVEPGALVQLNGTGSSDADGDPLTYSWSFVSLPQGSAATLSQATVPSPTFTADVAGTYTLQLTVGDGRVSSVPDQVQVRAELLPKAGRYTGTTSQGRPIAFVVSTTRTSVQSGLEITFNLACTFCTGWVKWTLGSGFAITNGGFSYSTGSAATFGRVELTGNQTSETTFSGTASNTPGPLSTPGCGSCSTQNVTWQATWAGPAPVEDSAAWIGPEVDTDVVRTVLEGACIDVKVTERKGDQGR